MIDQAAWVHRQAELQAQVAKLTRDLEAAQQEADKWRTSADLMHQINVEMLERRGIEWTPGEPFIAVVEAELEAARQHETEKDMAIARLHNETVDARARLDAAERVVDELLTLRREAALIDKAPWLPWPALDIALDAATVGQEQQP